ncbi:hypothetical protein GCM10023066_45650 [Nocardioides kongjuensis]
MKNRLGLTFLATGTLLLAAVSACAENDGDPPPTTPATSSQTGSTEPTTSPSPTSPNDAATANATAAMTDYYSVLDGLRADPSSDLKELETVAIGAQLNAVQTLVQRQRDQGQRQTGTTAISELKVQSVTLDNSDPDAGKVPTVVIDVCWDVTKVDVLDKSGKSIVSPDRPDTGWTRYTVANYEYAADPTGGWRVATGQDLKQMPCAAS